MEGETVASAGELEALAALERWPDEPAAGRIGRIGGVLTKYTETIVRKLEAGLPLEARQVAALERLVALCERIAVMAREQADKERKKSDEELAEIYRRVERRIIQLAGEEAQRLVVEVMGLPRELMEEKAPWLLTKDGWRQEFDMG